MPESSGSSRAVKSLPQTLPRAKQAHPNLEFSTPDFSHGPQCFLLQGIPQFRRLFYMLFLL